MTAETNVIPFTGTFRTLPHSVEAEKGLLGTLLMANKVFHRVSGIVSPEDFAVAFHGQLWDKIARTINAGGLADPVSFKEWCLNNDDLADVSGGEPLAYLAEICAAAVNTINAEHYAKHIADLSAKRSLIGVLEDTLQSAYSGEESCQELAGKHEASLTSVAIGTDTQGPVWWCDVVTEATAQWSAAAKGETTSIKTGLADLDSLTGGLFPGDLTVVAARPSMGKTALGLTISINAARRFQEEHGSVLFFSLEQPRDQLVTRDTAGFTGLHMPDIRAGRLESHDLKRLFQAAQSRSDLPILLDGRGGLTTGQIAATARRHVRVNGVRVIVVDYLQFIRADERYRGQKVNEIGEITASLKALAKELNIPVVLLCQLSRQVEQRDNKRPQLSDLRDSGNIEQDADCVMLLYREEYYLEREGEPRLSMCRDSDDYAEKLGNYRTRLDDCRNKAEIIVAKQRNGPTKTVHVRFEGARMRFENLGV